MKRFGPRYGVAMRKHTKESIEALVDRSGDCHLWTGYIYRPTGYGTVNFNGRPHRVHRLFYEWYVGPIPEGLTIDHLCNVRNCVNPDHLDVCSSEENCRRAGQRRDFCRNGHPTALYRRKVSTTGETYCIQCNRESSARRRRDSGVKPRGSYTTTAGG